jgi:antitoxin VapB
MAISIRNPRVEELARELGEKENLSMTQVILEALEEKRVRSQDSTAVEELRLKSLLEISERVKKLPVYDNRTADEILGYNEIGRI